MIRIRQITRAELNARQKAAVKAGYVREFRCESFAIATEIDGVVFFCDVKYFTLVAE